MNFDSKVVIRHLPACLEENDFLKTFEPIPNYNYFKFFPADQRLGKDAYARAYLNFLDYTVVESFCSRCASIKFDDGSSPSAEVAPFQDIPKDIIKADKRENTLDSDEIYLAFLKTIEESGVDNENGADKVNWETILNEIIEREKTRNEKVMTPLIKYLEELHQNKIARKYRKKQKKVKSGINENERKKTKFSKTDRKQTEDVRSSKRENKPSKATKPSSRSTLDAKSETHTQKINRPSSSTKRDEGSSSSSSCKPAHKADYRHRPASYKLSKDREEASYHERDKGYTSRSNRSYDMSSSLRPDRNQKESDDSHQDDTHASPQQNNFSRSNYRVHQKEKEDRPNQSYRGYQNKRLNEYNSKNL